MPIVTLVDYEEWEQSKGIMCNGCSSVIRIDPGFNVADTLFVNAWRIWKKEYWCQPCTLAVPDIEPTLGRVEYLD